MKTVFTTIILLLSASISMAAVKPQSSLDKAKAYADAHHQEMTVTPRDGFWWVEMDGSAIFGTGKTQDEAADDFNHCADLFENEPAHPAHHTCTDDRDCS